MTITINSTHKAEVVPVVLEKHPNADNLSIVRVWDYTVVVNTKQWEGINKAVYIVPDSVVDTTLPEFNFLSKEGKQHRVKVKKLRGIISMGLLIPAPEDAEFGEDYAERFNITKYEPPEPMITGGETAKPPLISCGTYDIDSFYRYADCFVEGESVVVTEKIDGAQARFVYQNGELHCGSKREWKKEGNNIWWKVLDKYSHIELWCKNNPDSILFGEIFGRINKLTYDAKPNEMFFRVFDVYAENRFYNFEEAFMKIYGYKLDWVPLIKQIPFTKEEVLKLATCKSTIANHIREGVVVKPVTERYDDRVGRVCLKVINNDYLEM